MAGFYPDAPGRKINHSQDGTILLQSNSLLGSSPNRLAGPWTELTGGADHGELVDHDTAGVTNLDFATPNDQSMGLLMIFPELRDIVGVKIHGTAQATTNGLLYDDGTTTNGMDGVWTLESSTETAYVSTLNPYPNYRNNIFTVSWSGIRAWQHYKQESGPGPQMAIFNIEVYGSIAAGETPDRLIWINNTTGLAFTKPLDVGDRPRGSALERIVRLKNNSGSLTANAVVVSTVELDQGITGGSASWYTYDSGAGFGSTLNISSIGPGSEATFTIRQNIPDSATPQVYEAISRAVTGSWS